MDLSPFCIRQFFSFFLVLGVIQQTQSFDYSKKPDNPFIVVEGVEPREKLEWEFLLSSASEVVGTIIVSLEKPGEKRVTIGGKSGPNGDYKVEDDMKNKYELEEPATLIIKEVNRSEDGYRYIFSVILQGEFSPHESSTTLEVFVPAKFTRPPKEITEVEIGKNVTLYCNASGDPDPNITWTKDGIPSRNFNVSGHVLHLPNVTRKIVGSYRCSASNGYGPVISQVGHVNLRCSQNDRIIVGITLTQSWKDAFGRKSSEEFKALKVNVTSEIYAVYADSSKLCRVTLIEFRSGSVQAFVELLFQKGTVKPLELLEKEIEDEKLGPYIGVEKKLQINPTLAPSTTGTGETTTQGKPPSSPGKRSGLSNSAMWGIIGACIAVALIVIIIIIVVCCCKKKSGSGGSATKIRPEGQQRVGIPGSGMATYSEADGYRMNRQYPGAGIGSPAYVEASQYAPANAVRKQNEPARQPPNYADLSFNNSPAAHKPPTNYPSTVYTEMSPSKQPQAGGGGQPGEKGFELWC